MSELQLLQNAYVKKLEENTLLLIDECERLEARNEELEAEVAKLEAGVDYYERIVAFIEDFEPRIVDDAREYIIKTQKEASHETP